MKIKCLIFFLFTASFVYAQNVHLKGRVVDAKSGEPIPAATISVIEKNLFFPADNAGKFDFDSAQLTASDSVAFSCIGYKTQRIKIRDMPPNGVVVQLVPALNLLKNVNVIAGSPSTTNVGCNTRFTGGTAGLLPGYEIAMFMRGSDTVKGVIQSVGYFVSNGHSVAKGGDATAPFRVKLYEADTDGSPGMELTKDIIIVNAKKNEAWFDVDLTTYHIANPVNGFFVSFCLLDSGYYKIKEGYKFKELGGNVVNFASPRLATHQLKQGECRSYRGFRSSIFGLEWEKGPYNDDYMIRAAVVPE